MMARKAILAAALTAAVLGGAAGAWGEVTSADLNVFVAEKFLGATAWGPTNRQGEIGLLTNWQWDKWPVLFAADLLAASRTAPVATASYTEEDAHSFELDLGARKIWKPTSSWRPYIGGGLALAYADIDYTGSSGPQPSITSGGYGVGAWVDGGVFWAITDVLRLGVDARFSSEDTRIFGSVKNAGGLHFGLLAGYHFGG
jgi:hypothetical protein